MKCLYDRKTKRRVFEPGDQVLVSCLLPSSPFEAKFEGPYVIKHRLSDENYVVATPHRRRSTRLNHVNLLKPFYEKSKSNSENPIHSVLAISDVKNFCSGQELEKEGYEPDDSVLRGRLNNTESLEKLDATLVHLSPSQSVGLISLLQSFPELFGDMQTDWAEHDIDVGNASPINQRYY